MGKVIETIDLEGFESRMEAGRRYMEEDANVMERLTGSSPYQLVKLAKKYDDWFLDPFVGFVLPAAGDVISAAAIFPALYIAAFKIRSFKLSFAIIYVCIFDLLIGVIPIAGDIIDAFYKSNKMAARWIVGYLENDAQVKKQVNRAARQGAVIFLLLAILLYLCYEMLLGIFHWLQDLAL